VEEIIGAGEDAIRLRDASELKSLVRELKRNYWRMNSARKDYWKEELERLRKKNDFVDAREAQRLIEEGARAALDNNNKALESTVRKLYALLPILQRSKLNEIFVSSFELA
jgi:hypothetical protein